MAPRKLTRHQLAKRLALVVATVLATFALAAPASAQSKIQAGVMACEGGGGWGLIITSRRTFDCTFSSDDGQTVGRYTAVIRRVGLDLGVTGNTALVWLVFGPASVVGDNFVAGSLQGSYAGVGTQVAVGLGLGANVLIGGGGDSFALQPVSVQVQTGLSVAAGVQLLELTFVGPVG